MESLYLTLISHALTPAFYLSKHVQKKVESHKTSLEKISQGEHPENFQIEIDQIKRSFFYGTCLGERKALKEAYQSYRVKKRKLHDRQKHIHF